MAKWKRIRLAPNESLILGNNAGLSNVEIIGVEERFPLIALVRRFLHDLWAGSAAIICPEHYAGGGWEPGACQGCEAKEYCDK